MANAFMSALKNDSNYKFTENGAVAKKSTMDKVYDMFAFGGAYRERTDDDVVLLFKNAYEQNPLLAMKCLFYLRDVRGGQGERRFFRLCMKWLARTHTASVRRNLELVPEFGRWDDLYEFIGTSLEKDAFRLMKNQLALDIQCKTPSLLAKWLKSENTSSAESRTLANKTREYFNMTHKQYRKTLSILRERIKVLERLMSANRWDEIEFDKIPSKAGLVYCNAFARRDMIKAKYEKFAKSTETKVNAKTLYPYEVVGKAATLMRGGRGYWYSSPQVDWDNTERLMINKYWDNLADYFKGASLDAMAIVDTSGSMYGQPLDVAISLGMYCAEKAKGPFHGNYISFSRNARLIEIEGVDFCDKVYRIYQKNLCENTNLESAFNLVLNTAIKHHLKQSDLPKNLIIISDMEIDSAQGYGYGWGRNSSDVKTTMDVIRRNWERAGYEMPNLIYWNVNARHNTILDDGPNITYVSGMSPSIFEQIMTNKTGIDLMLDKLNSERYAKVTV